VDPGHKAVARLTGDKRVAPIEGGGSPWLHVEVEQSAGVLTSGRTRWCGGCADLAAKGTNRLWVEIDGKVLRTHKTQHASRNMERGSTWFSPSARAGGAVPE
jgi:hypothetical protein